jgi:quinone-modifying oxidoreductase subunit QmoC
VNALARPAPYANDFLREVEERVERGDWVRMCMQCGVCAGSCPLGEHWEHSPQKIFMMIRAGKRDEVLKSDAVWMCTSCYNCIVRCPRQLPITHIIHGLATYAHRQGLAPRVQPTRDFSLQFWGNSTRTGRVNEMRLTLGLYFHDGFVAGLKKGWSMRNVAFGLLRARRLNPLELVKGHECEDKAGIQRILAKAYALEDARRGKPVA